MDGFSLGLKKFIFSKKDSSPTSSNRTGRSKLRGFLSSHKKGQRDTSPFEELRNNGLGETYEGERPEIDGERLTCDADEVGEISLEFEYRERDASGFEEIDWPELETPRMPEDGEKSTGGDFIQEDSLDRISSTGEEETENQDLPLSDISSDIQLAESNVMADESCCSEKRNAFSRPKGSCVASLSDSIQDELDVIEIKAERHKPMTREQFLSFFDSDGRVVDETKLRRIIFKGGVEEDIREDVWQFLFELYPCNSTKREREVMRTEHSIHYKALKARWRPLLKQISLDPKSGLRFCPEWLHKRKVSVVGKKPGKMAAETSAKVNEDIAGRENLSGSDNSNNISSASDAKLLINADVKEGMHQRKDGGEAKTFSVKHLKIGGSLAKSRFIEGADVKLRVQSETALSEEEAAFNMADDEDVHPIADVHGSTVEDIREAIKEAMIEEPRFGGTKSNDCPEVCLNFQGKSEINSRDHSTEGSFENKYRWGKTGLQDIDTNCKKVSDFSDTKKSCLRSEETESGSEPSIVSEADKGGSLSQQDEDVDGLEAFVQAANLESGDLKPKTEAEIIGARNSSAVNNSIFDNSVASGTSVRSKEVLLDFDDGIPNAPQFQENDYGMNKFPENETKYEYSLETLLLSRDISLCELSGSPDRPQLSNEKSGLSSFLEESDKEAYFQEGIELDADVDLLALQEGVNLSTQGDTILSDLLSFEGTVEASDWPKDNGQENQVSSENNGSSDLLAMKNSPEMFSGETRNGSEKEVTSNNGSVSGAGNSGVEKEADDDGSGNIVFSSSKKEANDEQAAQAHDRSEVAGSTISSVRTGPTTNRTEENRNREETGGLQTDLIDFSPIKPTSLNLADGRADGQMPKWLEQQLIASSPAGTKTKRTINIHEAGISNIEDMNSVISVKEITEKASMVVRKKLCEQSKQPLRSSTPVQEPDGRGTNAIVDDLCGETGDEDKYDAKGDVNKGIVDTPVRLAPKRVKKLPSYARSTSVDEQELDDSDTIECWDGDDVSKANGLIQSASLSNLHNHGLKSIESPRKAYSEVNLIDNSQLYNAEHSALNFLKNLDESISKSDSNVYTADRQNGQSPIEDLEPHDESKCVYCGVDDERVVKDILTEDFMNYVEIQAKLHAARQVYDVDVISQGLRIIDKDVPRTDRALPYFRGNDNPNLLKLRDALITYAFFHPDVGYAQGMNDIMSRFFVVMDSEADAYWMFCSYMDHFKGDFLENDMLRKISLVEQLLMKMDRELYDFLQSLQMELIFCHRWLLLTFKREFSYQDGLRIFEIISSRHLEVSSPEAEMERSRERARELEKDEGSRMEEIYVSPEYSFDVFVCVAMLHECRDRLMNTNDVASIYQLMASLPNVNDLDTILSRAEDLFFKYCRKSTIDCFQVIDEPIEKTLNWKQRFLIDF